MTATATDPARKRPKFPKPQLAPPVPLKGRRREFEDAAKIAGLELMGWQQHVGRYLTATSKSGAWLYPEVAVIAPRQNGKTTCLVARIVMGLMNGERIMHTAQNRELPREIFNLVSDVIDPALMTHLPRKASGQERIDMRNGGVYRIVAPSRGGARGPANDLVIVDEIREFTDFEFIAAAKPTLTMSEHPQIMYLSNAGDDSSIVLNTLRKRSETERDLAYVEWSAPPQYPVDDRKGWRLANPAAAEMPQIMEYLEREYADNLSGDTLSVFETEHLCRWVVSMAPRLVGERAWLSCRGVTEGMSRPVLAFNMDATGRRASAVRAWLQTDGRIAIEEVIEATGDPIDVQRLGNDLEAICRREGVKRSGFASWTDADIARYVKSAKALDGKEFSAASEQFARYVLSGRIVWDTAGHVTDDLAWTARKPTGQDSGAWMAVPASDRSVTAILAAIRAVWLASAPKPPVPRIG